MRTYIYVLDTCVLISDPWHALHTYSDGLIVLPLEVIEELDKKRGSRSKGARYMVHLVEQLQRAQKLVVDINDYKQSLGSLRGEVPDNLILRSALAFQIANPFATIVFVTNDRLLRVKALAFGLLTREHKSIAHNRVDSYNIEEKEDQPFPKQKKPIHNAYVKKSRKKGRSKSVRKKHKHKKHKKW